MTLAALLATKRNVRSRVALPALSDGKIARWARAYRKQHGRWPNRECGAIPGSGGETWSSIAIALKRGSRGLKGSSSLARFMKRL